MTKDEALKFALEKFEFMNHVDSIFEGEFNFQINAIKEALAQQDSKDKEQAKTDSFVRQLDEALAQPEPWEKFCDSNCVWTDHHPDCKLAQPEQEPVAWTSLLVGEHHGIIGKAGDAFASAPEHYRRVDVYTTPPQRTWVGLTEKDICEAAVKSQEGISPRDDTLRFAIAIEAKLKEKNT